jgi:hypothetical protein
MHSGDPGSLAYLRSHFPLNQLGSRSGFDIRISSEVPENIPILSFYPHVLTHNGASNYFTDHVSQLPGTTCALRHFCA